jgi:hypothetical protein
MHFLTSGRQIRTPKTNVARAEYDRWATLGDADPEIPSAIVSYTTSCKCLVNYHYKLPPRAATLAKANQDSIR